MIIPDLDIGVLYIAAEEGSREVKHVEDVEREGGRVTLAESVEGLYEYSPVPNIYKYDLR